MPGEADLGRGCYAVGADYDVVAVDLGLGRDKFSVCAGDFEFTEGFSVPGFEATCGVGEGKANFCALDLHRLVERT